MSERPTLYVATPIECDRKHHKKIGRLCGISMAIIIVITAIPSTSSIGSADALTQYHSAVLIAVFATLCLLSAMLHYQSEIIRKSAPIRNERLTAFSENLQTCLSIREARQETQAFIRAIKAQKRSPIIKEAEALERFTNHFKNLYWEEVFMTRVTDKWKNVPPIFPPPIAQC